MTAREIQPGDVLGMAAGAFRVDSECRCVDKRDRVLWFWPQQAVTVLRRESPKAPRPFPAHRFARPEAIGVAPVSREGSGVCARPGVDR